MTPLLRRRAAALLLLLLALAPPGCNRGPERVPVGGRVNFDGKPVVRGAIRFVPDEHTEAPVSGAVIMDGRYDVARGGVPVGTHRVRIEAFEGGPDDGDVNKPAGRQYLPPRYNRSTELTMIITPGSGPITKDFDLTR